MQIVSDEPALAERSDPVHAILVSQTTKRPRKECSTSVSSNTALYNHNVTSAKIQRSKLSWTEPHSFEIILDNDTVRLNISSAHVRSFHIPFLAPRLKHLPEGYLTEVLNATSGPAFGDRANPWHCGFTKRFFIDTARDCLGDEFSAAFPQCFDKAALLGDQIVDLLRLTIQIFSNSTLLIKGRKIDRVTCKV